MSEELTLTQPQKAAAILVAMGKPSAGRLLKFFKHEELKALIESARMLRTIPQAQLEKIVSEFEAEFTQGAGLLDSADTIDNLLSEALTPEEVNVLMGRVAPRKVNDGTASVWEDLEKLDPARICKLVQSQHPQAIAYILEKLKPETASRVIVTLEKPVRTEVVKRMVSTNPVKPATQQMMERQMRAMLQVETGGRDISAGQTRVAGILNELDKSEIDEVMQDLEESGSKDVKGIRSRLFSFEEIELLSQKSRVALFDGLATDLVTLALRNATPDLRGAVLSALGQRSRRMIESELQSGGDEIPLEEISRARKRIASTALTLAQRGTIELPSAAAEAEAA